jgi:hypothetical protein
MAINLKEIFEGDSDFIKTEKINYNFDQILANGGGPAGPEFTRRKCKNKIAFRR